MWIVAGRCKYFTDYCPCACLLFYSTTQYFSESLNHFSQNGKTKETAARTESKSLILNSIRCVVGVRRRPHERIK